MDTQVRTPQAIFMQPQRLLVPLFQRPYVWNEERQWEPLWRDLERVSDRFLKSPNEPQQPHFLGAVVFQQLASQTSDLQQRTVIDGQQRLTTLQLLLDAIHAEIEHVGAAMPAARLDPLIANSDAFCRKSEDRFKVWPTNRDRPAFNEVMAADAPVQYDALANRASRLVKAHQFFSRQCREWLNREGDENRTSRAEAIERSVRELLQIVVIDLSPNENAQEIFETLNARGAVLTAADLIKNFVFQRLSEKGADVESAYSQHWAQFETAFWEAEVNVGRVRLPRSSVFLNQWLVAKTGLEVVAREVFSGFKSYADFQTGRSMPELLSEIHRAAGIYRQFTESGTVMEGDLDRSGLFSYRAKALESEVIKPVVLAILDHEQGPISPDQVKEAFGILESWLARRMLVRATSKAYNKIMADVVTAIRQDSRREPARVLREYFTAQKAETAYWPDDDDVRRELQLLPVYRKMSRGRLRMILEAIEDHLRGWDGGKASYSGMRIRRGTFAIEHLMPQSWAKHWPMSEGVTEAERDKRIHVLGNLTLLTKRLNSTVSNGPWNGENGKAAHLQKNDVLLLNSRVLMAHREAWTESTIDARTESMIAAILAIWPVPPGHKSSVRHQEVTSVADAEIADLLEAGLLAPGQTLYSMHGKYAGRSAQVLSDGRIDVDGKIFDTPSGAGAYVRQGKATNGWGFWLVDFSTRKSLRNLRAEYRANLEIEGFDTESDDDEAEAPS